MLNLLVSVKGSLTGISGDGYAIAATALSLAMTSFGIPLTGSMSAGFTIGFMNRMITAEYPNIADVSICK